MIAAVTGRETCQVRSGTDAPCGRPAALQILGVSFCESCAREQEAYFLIGELTSARGGDILREETLLGALGRVRRGLASSAGVSG